MSDVHRTPTSADGPSKLTSAAPAADATIQTPSVARPRTRTGWRAVAAGLITAIMLVVTLGVAAFAQTGNAAAGPTFLAPGSFLYAELRLDLPGDQREQLMSFLGHLPGFADPAAFDTKLDQTVDQMLGGPGSPISWTTDIKPWFGGQVMLGVSEIPPMSATATDTAKAAPVVIAISSTDRAALDAALAKLVASSTMSSVTSEDYAGTTIWSSDSGGSITAIAPTDGLLLLSNDVTHLKASLDLLAAGGPSLADDAAFQTAMGVLPSDRIGAFYVDTAQLKDAILPLLQQSMQSQTSMGVTADQLQAVLALLPPAITGYARVDADHLTFRLDAGNVAGTPTMSVRTTDIASKMPADTIVYLETRDLGAALKTIVGQLKPLLAAQGNDQALAQIEALLGTGLDSYLDWVQDIGIGASVGAAGPSVGLVATVTDEAVGQQRIDALLTLIRAVSATADPSPVSITTEDVNGVSVTSIAITNSAMTAGLPVEARISIAIGGGHLYLGLGDFAKQALSQDPAASLASSASYTKAAAAVGDNAGLLYVDVAKALSFAELMMTSDQRDMFDSQIKPYADALDFVVASVNQDANTSSASVMLFVK